MDRLSRLSLAASLALLLATGDGCAAEPATDANPYIAGPKLSRAELSQYLEELQAKPETIRKRPGFQEAVIDAADRVLAGGADDAAATAALLAKFAALHVLSLNDRTAADETLAVMADRWRKDPRAEVSREAKFHLLERLTLEADELEPAELGKLLSKLKEFFAGVTADQRHLRLASATVRVINRLPDDAAAEQAYRDFGRMWAKSPDPQLAKYGKKIEKGPKKAE